MLEDLLTNHVNAHLFTSVINRVSLGIDILAVILIILALIVPLWQMFLMATRFLLLFVGSDSILNDIYMTQRLKMVREKSMADKSKIRDLLDIELDDDEDLGLQSTSWGQRALGSVHRPRAPVAHSAQFRRTL